MINEMKRVATAAMAIALATGPNAWARGPALQVIDGTLRSARGVTDTLSNQEASRWITADRAATKAWIQMGRPDLGNPGVARMVEAYRDQAKELLDTVPAGTSQTADLENLVLQRMESVVGRRPDPEEGTGNHLDGMKRDMAVAVGETLDLQFDDYVKARKRADAATGDQKRVAQEEAAAAAARYTRLQRWATENLPASRDPRRVEKDNFIAGEEERYGTSRPAGDAPALEPRPDGGFYRPVPEGASMNEQNASVVADLYTSARAARAGRSLPSAGDRAFHDEVRAMSEGLNLQDSGASTAEDRRLGGEIWWNAGRSLDRSLPTPDLLRVEDSMVKSVNASLERRARDHAENHTYTAEELADLEWFPEEARKRFEAANASASRFDELYQWTREHGGATWANAARNSLMSLDRISNGRALDQLDLDAGGAPDPAAPGASPEIPANDVSWGIPEPGGSGGDPWGSPDPDPYGSSWGSDDTVVDAGTYEDVPQDMGVGEPVVADV